MPRSPKAPKAPAAPKKKKPINIQAKTIQAMRKVWRNSSPERKATIEAARDPLNPKNVICGVCGQSVRDKLAAVDHIEPVVTEAGFTSWDSFYARLHCPQSNLTLICEQCHAQKTKTEAAARAAFKRAQKPPKVPKVRTSHSRKKLKMVS